MTWLLTHTGREHYLCGPSATHPDNVPSLAEIAHALAHINRYTGHAARAYSVAEHSLLCADIARSEFDADAGGQLAALLHDAHECITGDVASPIKQVLGTVWAQFEALHEHQLRTHYQLLGLYRQHSAMVKQCDLIALATERRDLTAFNHFTHKPWPVIDTLPRGSQPLVRPWGQIKLMSPGRAGQSPYNWALIFEDRAHELLARTQDQRTGLDNALEQAA